MKSKFKDIISNIFGPKSWVDENWCAPDNHVAAGDPAHGGMASNLPADFPIRFFLDGKEIITDRFETFVVDGSSMVPKGISNGSVLLCRPVKEADLNNIGKGKYLIVKVDPDYYSNKNKKASFKYKLRRSLADVPENPVFSSLLQDLKKSEDSLLKESNQKALQQKFEEVYGYYDRSRPMVLSVTYRDGHIRYSFHPKNLVAYVAEYVVVKLNGRYEIHKV